MINKNGEDNKYDTENVNDKQKSVDNEYDTDVNFYMLINHLLKKNLKTLGRGGGGGGTPLNIPSLLNTPLHMIFLINIYVKLFVIHKMSWG